MRLDHDRQAEDGSIRRTGAVDEGLAGWNDAMYEKCPTPYEKGLAGVIQRARVRAILSLAGITSSDTVLEVGCESGRLLSRLPGCARTVGVDISMAALRNAGEHLSLSGRSVELYQTDVESGLPFERGEFSVIICSEVLEHVVTPRSALESIGSIATVETRVVLTIPLEMIKLRVKQVLRKLGLMERLFPGIEEGQSEWHRHVFSDTRLRAEISGLFSVIGKKTVWLCHSAYLCKTTPGTNTGL